MILVRPVAEIEPEYIYAGFKQVEGFLFVSSPNSTTPFHLDSEDNFFVHVHGEKFFTIFDNIFNEGGCVWQGFGMKIEIEECVP